jgi:hypothetical protein
MSKLTKKTVEVQTDIIKLMSYKSQGEELAAFLSEKPCETPEEEQWFSQTLSSVRGLLKGLEDARTQATKPLLAAKREIDNLFSPATAPLKHCESTIRLRLADAARMRFAAAAESRRLAADAAAEGRFADVLAVLDDAQVTVATAGSSARVAWVARVVDINLVPRQYLMVNETALTAAGKGTEQPLQIPGIEWEMEAKVRAKS